jgi:uncharacterized protein YndB with AHSA1/START domain
MTAGTTGPEPFRASVRVEAAPERVYEYFTRAEAMVRWMGEYALLDAREGGEFAVDVGGVPVRGRYVELDPPHRLVISWGHAGSDVLPPGASTVEVRLAAVAGGTEVELVHCGLPEPLATRHAQGWPTFLARLAEVSARPPRSTGAAGRG